jgi:RNA polymerase II subunit A small phosphatase-like protein
MIDPKPDHKAEMKTLVLELDSVILSSSFYQKNKPDLKVPLNYKGKEVLSYVKFRPYCREFLSQMAKIFDIVVYTSSRKEYASKILKYLDYNNEIFSAKLYREDCLYFENSYLKDLGRLSPDRKMEEIIIIESDSEQCKICQRNILPVKYF